MFKHGNKPEVVLAFGSPCSVWILPNYEPLREEFELRILNGNPGCKREWLEDVSTTRRVVGKVPRPLPKVVSFGLDRLWPTWDRILEIDKYLPGAAIVHTLELCGGVSVQVARRKRRYGYKHVVTAWENIAGRMETHPLAQRAKHAVIESADRYVAVSQRAKTALMLEGVSQERISVIGPGIALPERAEHCPPASHRFRLLFVGKKARSKGVEELLCALWLLRRDGELADVQIELTFLGITPSQGPYAALVRRYGLGAALTEIPFVPHEQVLQHYRRADALVVPSRVTPLWQEQWGMVFMEAMSQGTPIVTTHSGSIEEVAGEAALYARPNDHHSLYLRLKELIRHGDLWRRMSRKAVSIAGERFDAGEVALRLKRLYQELLA